MARPPIDDATRLRIVELADSGLSVRRIARELGIGTATVSRAAAEMGVAFDRAATAAATEARIRDGKARRATLAGRALAEAGAELDKLHQPCRVVAVAGGRPAGIHTLVVPRPPAAERVAIAKVFDTLVANHLRLIEADGRDDTEAAKSLLGDIGKLIDRAAELAEDEAGEP